MSLLVFTAYVFFFYLLPGWQTTRPLKLKKDLSTKVLVSLAVGMAQLMIVSFGVGWLGLRWLVWGLVFWGALGLKSFNKTLLKAKIKKGWLIPILVILAAVVFQQLVMVKSGRLTERGVVFWGVHGHDGVWHLSLIDELSRHFPPQNPAFAGVRLQNYHYFFDLLLAECQRWTTISTLRLYFHFYPVLLSLLANSLIFKLVAGWTKRKRAGLWAVLWFSFCSSFGSVLPWLGAGSRNWETAFWAMQPALSLQNPPFYLSLVLILTLATLLVELSAKKKVSRWSLWVPVLLLGSLLEVKVYGGLVVLASLGWLGFWQAIKTKKIGLLQIFSGGLILGFLIYFSAGGESAGFIRFEPGWFLRIMYEAPDRIGWINPILRLQKWQAQGQGLLVAVFWAVSAIIFIAGNLGTRIVGVFLKADQWRSFLAKFLTCLIVFGFLPTFFFTQSHVAWNTIQFAYYAVFGAGLLAAIGFENLVERLPYWLGLGLAAVLILLSLPGSVQTAGWHLGELPATVVSLAELEVLSYLREEALPEATVLVYPYRPGQEGQIMVPVPLAYYNTAYVAFFSQRRVYLADETAALIQGYDYSSRVNQAWGFFSTTDSVQASRFLSEEEIDYIYLVGAQAWRADLEGLVEPAFSQPGVRLYKVK